FIESVILHDIDDPARGYVDYASAVTQSDLEVTIESTTSPAFAGQELTLLVRVINFGPSEANNVSVSVPVPAGSTFVSVATSHGTAAQAGRTVTATLGTLAHTDA